LVPRTPSKQRSKVTAGSAGDAPELRRPPFAVAAHDGPQEVADEIMACFERLAARKDSMAHAHALAMRSIGIGDGDPLYRAGRAIARDIDRGIGAGVPHGYHNARHFLEAMLCALYLARLSKLDRRRSSRVVTAALIHDFHHDGSRSSEAPFRLEALACVEAEPYLQREGVTPRLRQQIQALVLATEPSCGVPFARDCVAHHADGAPAPALPDAPQALSRLVSESDLALDAVLLAEADVLPSIGMTVEHGERTQANLATEWGVSLGIEDKLAFVDRVAGNITLARFFAPNIEALRQAYLRRL
jgi:hypothetical protein